jgi:energy-coupling factor transport system permease protein
LGLLVAVAWLVVAARRPQAPWARSFGSFVKLGVAVLVVRLLLQALFGLRLPGHVLFTLPSIHLPDWAAGVTLGGPVTSEAMAAAFRDGLQLAALLACVGAANSLASPYRLLRSMPAVLYELGVVVTVALSFAPQAALSAQRVRDARRLRGRPHRGLAGLRGLAVPVLETALERSLQLAASMDSRGYGRRAAVLDRRRRLTQAAGLVGALALTIGLYGVLDEAAPGGLGVPMLAAGSVLLVASMMLTSARSTRTRYRPDPWRWPEWGTVIAGGVVLIVLVVAANVDGAALRPSYSPLTVPSLPLFPVVGVLIAGLPVLLTPPLPEDRP